MAVEEDRPDVLAVAVTDEVTGDEEGVAELRDHLAHVVDLREATTSDLAAVRRLIADRVAGRGAGTPD